MATLQVRIDDNMKVEADSLFSSLGLDTSTEVRIFISVSLENNGLPFEVKRKTLHQEGEKNITSQNYCRY